ncbi:hypothetical protein DFP74_6089 [Nocardiopsis sp. Huas11]|nr:hypothetical protein DFP74_6089 [Nocardiopsis sp. Huas11]
MGDHANKGTNAFRMSERSVPAHTGRHAASMTAICATANTPSKRGAHGARRPAGK